MFDTSNYPKDHFLYSEANKKVYGKFKDEAAGVPIMEFCGLRAKMYSFLLKGGKEHKTAKGIKKSYCKNRLTHLDYLKTVMGNNKRSFVEFNTIRSSNHQLGSYRLKKVGLCRYDDKRHVEGITSLAHGHQLIQIA